MAGYRWAAVAATLLLSACGGGNAGVGNAGGTAAEAFDAAAKSPPLLRAFLYRMPKGGDLHNHLSGAAYAEANIRAGAAAGGCVDPVAARMVFTAHCVPPNRPLSDATTDAALNRTLVNAWSMRDFVPSSGNSGHDQFFSAFARFGGAAPMGDMAAEVVNRAGRRDMRYVELRATVQSQALGKLADAVEMCVHGAAARRQLALLVGGEGGQVLVREAEEALKSRGVRNPERYAGMLLPGKWASES